MHTVFVMTGIFYKPSFSAISFRIAPSKIHPVAKKTAVSQRQIEPTGNLRKSDMHTVHVPGVQQTDVDRRTFR